MSSTETHRSRFSFFPVDLKSKLEIGRQMFEQENKGIILLKCQSAIFIASR
jgi:hypothetical protein